MQFGQRILEVLAKPLFFLALILALSGVVWNYSILPMHHLREKIKVVTNDLKQNRLSKNNEKKIEGAVEGNIKLLEKLLRDSNYVQTEILVSTDIFGKAIQYAKEMSVSSFTLLNADFRDEGNGASDTQSDKRSLILMGSGSVSGIYEFIVGLETMHRHLNVDGIMLKREKGEKVNFTISLLRRGVQQ